MEARHIKDKMMPQYLIHKLNIYEILFGPPVQLQNEPPGYHIFSVTTVPNMSEIIVIWESDQILVAKANLGQGQ